ncbi:LOW QUALITY PROTEIN: hypothetical protein V1478_009608, partial [Vespula squamosa]
MPFLQTVTKSGRNLELCTDGPSLHATISQSNIGIVHWRSFAACCNTTIEPVIDFGFHASINGDLKLRAMQSLESCITEEDLNQLRCQPIPHATTYQSFTHDFDLPHFQPIRIIHPQFRPKSRSFVLEPSQNILSKLTIVLEYSIVVVRARSKEEAVCRRGPHKLWLKRATIRLLSYFRRHDRSCLEMSEADGVDGGAFRKRGLTHLQWAEKPEAPEAERHLGTRDLEVPDSPWVPECSNLLAVGPGSEILALYEKSYGKQIGKTLTRVTAGTRVGVSGASLSPTEDFVLIFEISKYRHDRSCLEMSEADGVDGGAFRKRGLTHLQWAEKPEAPEAERHLGTRDLEVPDSPWVPECSNLLAVGPGSEILALYEKSYGKQIGKTLTRVTAGTRVGVSGASLSPTEDFVLIFEISKYRHDRSCLEMSEADGVDGGAFRKRGLTHLQWAEKPEAPEAERHLGTRDLEVPDSPWVPECSNLLAVGPGSEILALYEKSYGKQIGKTLTRVTAGTRVGVSGASLSPTEDFVLIFEISKYRHDRSCLEMSEADGVDGGAFRKRGLTHLQWAEKPEAPEAERHLGTRFVDLVPTYSTYSRECFRDTRVSIVSAVGFNLGSRRIFRDSTTGRAQVWRSPRCFDILIIVVVVKSRISVSSWVPECSNLHVVGPGS